MDNYTFWMPPLFFLIQSLFFTILPSSIEIARSINSFIGLLDIILVISIARNFGFSLKQLLLSTILLCTDFLFIKVTHTLRMEGTCLFFALLSIYFLSIGFLDRKIKKREAFLAGLFLSLSFLSHPFAVVYGLPILYLYWYRSSSWKHIGSSLIAGVLPILAWAFYIHPEWELFRLQFGAQLSRKNTLLSEFPIFTKVTIILSAFDSPRWKALSILASLLLFIPIKRKIVVSSLSKFFLFWTLSVLIFLFLSSESWYVFHIITPFSLLIVSFSEIGYLRYLPNFTIIFNLFILSKVLLFSFILYNTPASIEAYFKKIADSIRGAKSAYIHTIPDPYFYLEKKYPDLRMREFLPGQLPVIDKESFEKTIKSQDAFIFYEEALVNPLILSYLQNNSELFQKKEIKLETNKKQGLNLKAIIYLKK